MVKLKELTTGNEFLWDRNQFINRKYLMAEMYQRFLEGDTADVPKVSASATSPRSLHSQMTARSVQ